MNPSGPCLPHCYCSPTVKITSQLAIAYVVASIIYLAATRNIGTPFKDSLTQEQLIKKRTSSHTRGRIFIIGLAIGWLVATNKFQFHTQY
jgi:uncharacterized membrane protein YbjE (DUF340 family)